MNKTPQYQHPEGQYLELSVRGADLDELRRGVDAAWEYLLAMHVSPVDAACAEVMHGTCLPEGYSPNGTARPGIWTEANKRAIEACCSGWRFIPVGSKLNVFWPELLG